MRRLIVTAVAAAMVLTSCSSVTKTRESAESNEAGGYAAAYTEILGQYEDKIRLIEDSEDHSFDPCALYDITGDGIPELFIVYASDEEEAHPVASGTYELAALSIYTYDEERDRAESMMHWPSFANFEESALIPGTDIDTGDTLGELVYLNDGNIIVHYTFGVLDSFYDNYLVMAVDDDDLTRVAGVEGAVSSSGSQYFVESDELTGVLDEDEFGEFIAGYAGNVEEVIFGSSRIEGMISLSDRDSVQMSYDDIMSELS